MTEFVLLMSIVPHNKAEQISNAALKAGSFGGTVFLGRNISKSNIMAALGLGENTVDIVIILANKDTKDKIQSSIIQECSKERANFGYMYSIDADTLVKTGTITGGMTVMAQEKKQELITVILNKGYADDAMAAARKAGAGGGTVVNARGTAREDDAQFFGMHIVPEKEMLLIVVDTEKKDAVLEAIRQLPCLLEPGSGIAFCTGVSEFTILGKKDSQDK